MRVFQKDLPEKKSITQKMKSRNIPSEDLVGIVSRVCSDRSFNVGPYELWVALHTAEIVRGSAEYFY